MSRLGEANRELSARFNRMFPERQSAADRFTSMLQQAVREAHVVLDIGSGRAPAIPVGSPARRGGALEVWGLDIDATELASAPPGAYARTFATDAAHMAGVPDASVDVAFSRAVLEHVADPRRSMREAFRVLRPGGVALHLIPGGWSPASIANRVMPATLSHHALRLMHGGRLRRGKFPAFYRHATPTAAAAIMREAGFADVQVHCHFHADYLAALFPAHVVMVAFQNLLRRLNAEPLCDAFVISGVKPRDGARS